MKKKMKKKIRPNIMLPKVEYVKQIIVYWKDWKRC